MQFDWRSVGGDDSIIHKLDIPVRPWDICVQVRRDRRSEFERVGLVAEVFFKGQRIGESSVWGIHYTIDAKFYNILAQAHIRLAITAAEYWVAELFQSFEIVNRALTQEQEVSA